LKKEKYLLINIANIKHKKTIESDLIDICKDVGFEKDLKLSLSNLNFKQKNRIKL